MKKQIYLTVIQFIADVHLTKKMKLMMKYNRLLYPLSDIILTYTYIYIKIKC